MDTETRTCRICMQTLPIARFATLPSGNRRRVCKGCVSKQRNPRDERAYYAAHAEARRGSNKKHRESHRDTRRQQADLFRQLHPDAVKAHRDSWRQAHPERIRAATSVKTALRQALRTGTITRPAGCEQCQKLGRVEAAHYNYDEPLNVRWLCVSCHRLWDAAQPKTKRYEQHHHDTATQEHTQTHTATS